MIARVVAAAAVLPCLVSAAPAPRPGQVLIARLQVLADSGRMGDPDFVARTMGVTFSPADEQSTPPIMAPCAPGLTALPWHSVTRHPDPAIAPKPTPFGRARMAVPAFTINPGGKVAGKPALTYAVRTEHDCTGYVSLATEQTAEISFGPMSTYDCVTPDELRQWVPAATYQQGSDGAENWSYRNNRTGARISFDFFAFTPCMLSIDVEQAPRLTPRYAAARRRQQLCMVPHQAAFCRRHAPFGWGDGDVQGEMDAFAERRCGTLDSFYARTPASPREVSMPPALSRAGSATPCARIEAALGERR